MDEEISKCNVRTAQFIDDRNAALHKIGNLVHHTCVISNDEVSWITLEQLLLHVVSYLVQKSFFSYFNILAELYYTTFKVAKVSLL